VMSEERITRRDAIKRAAYMTPVILTFLAAPAFASGGSGGDERKYESQHEVKYEGSEAAESDEKVGGNGKRGRRWLWDQERERRRQRKKLWPPD
jgi:hypothetical protein